MLSVDGRLPATTPPPPQRVQVSIGIALAAFFLNGNQWPNFLLLDWQPAIFKLQLWRLFTPFLYLGPVGMNFALTVHFAWTYMSQLEKLHYREPHTFVMLLAFGMSRCSERLQRHRQGSVAEAQQSCRYTPYVSVFIAVLYSTCCTQGVFLLGPS